MKKVFLIAFAFLSVLFLSGCEKKYNPEAFSFDINYDSHSKIVTIYFDGEDFICTDEEGVSWMCATNIIGKKTIWGGLNET